VRCWIALGVVAVSACGRAGFDGYEAGLVAGYPLDDDPARGMIRDASGHGHDATCTPGVSCPAHTTGPTGGALVFDGATSVLSLAPGGLELPPPYTIAVWMRLDANPVGFGCALCRPVNDTASDTYALYVGDTYTLFATTDSFEIRTPAPDLGRWTHAAATYDGTNKQLFVDGVLAATGTSPLPPVDDHTVLIGGDLDFGEPRGFFPGALADLRIYGRVLDEGEVTGLAAPGTPR